MPHYDDTRQQSEKQVVVALGYKVELLSPSTTTVNNAPNLESQHIQPLTWIDL